jgi:hypothetical protein
MTNQDTRIRELAHRMWEASEKAEGRDLEFWHMAEHWVRIDVTCRENHRPHVIPFTQGADLSASHNFRAEGS